ncbi:glycosyltransferase family 2 protein [Fictibacillus terranigra]|uniref:Glycosyltransferase n=1 Tax=Fictibacillus terranigra TaxID=3058424 RepID=A0ABT8E1G9_9BACL|nr:glycosyltransferase [Fictibacillus sp. CENA-BCM004]MDN4071765.1 glycosyltransferase [Fictibacillus sp. CENA-BCM004]
MYLPKVSIVTPCFNASEFIEETIKSVQSQTYNNWELIIVDDNSSDNSTILINNLKKTDNRIKLIELNNNVGPAKARNIAMENAEGKYIAFLDSDDLWLPSKLERQIEIMEKHDLILTFSNYRIIEENGELTSKVIKVPEKINYAQLLGNTIIGCLTVVFNREKTGDVRMPEFRDCPEDSALWLSILRSGSEAVGIQEELALYRKTKGSLSRNKIKAARKTWNMYRKLEKLNVIKSSFCFLNYSYNAMKKL